MPTFTPRGFINKFKLFRNIAEAPLLFYVVTIAGVSNGFVLPFLRNINLEVTRSYLMVSISEGLFIVVLATMGIIWGIGFDNVENRRLLMLVAMEGAALFIYLTSKSTSALSYLVCRFMTGFFISAVYAFIMSMVADVYGAGERIYVFLTVYLIMNIMMGVGSGIALFLSIIMDWRKVIILYSMILGGGAWLLLLSKEPPRGGAEREYIKMSGLRILGRKRIKQGIVEIKNIFRVKTNIMLVLQGFFGCIPWGAMGLFLIYAIMEKTGGTFLVIGAIFAFAGIFYPVSLLLAPRVDKFRSRGRYDLLIMVAMLVILMQTVLFIIAISLPLPSMNPPRDIYGQLKYVIHLLGDVQVLSVVITYGLFICVASLAGPITRNIIADVNEPQRRATTVMVIRFFESVGNSIGLVVAGLAIDINKSFLSPFNFIWIFWIVCAFLWMPLFRTYKIDSEKMQILLAEKLA